MTNNTQFKTLVNTWLNQKKPMITPSTHASFTLIAENHLIPYFGKRKIGSITEADIQSYISYLYNAGRLDKTGGLKVLTADDTISPYLQSAIARNWHSLSDLNEYAELVLSGCFDTVLFKDKLTVTFRVKRKEEINVLDLANFVLCAARLLSDDKPETVQVKTTLHSPGDVILQIWNFAQENAFPLLICYMAIFGGKARDYEFHSIIGVIKGIINHKYDEDKKKIELRKLSAEADLAEQQALKQKLENIETMRRLQLSSVDAYAEPLATAAKNLAVQPSSATIIDITKILKSQQEDQPPQ